MAGIPMKAPGPFLPPPAPGFILNMPLMPGMGCTPMTPMVPMGMGQPVFRNPGFVQGAPCGMMPMPPAGFPPGFPVPAGFPMPMPVPPAGFPPGFGPQGGGGAEASGTASPSPDASPEPAVELKAEAPEPKAAAEVSRKKRPSGVEGLASSKRIRSGGAVTVYNGLDAVTSAPKPEAATLPAAAPAKSAATQALPRQLPEGWEMKRSRTTGKIYYVNEKLGKSQFDPPPGAVMKATERRKEKVVQRPTKDIPDAQLTDRNGLIGLVRATDKKLGRWQKWQKCNQILNEPDPDEKADD